MIFAETVIAGAPDPGTPPKVLSSPAGYYVGYCDSDGLPYSRETEYFESQETAEQNHALFCAAIAVSVEEAQKLPFVRR